RIQLHIHSRHYYNWPAYLAPRLIVGTRGELTRCHHPSILTTARNTEPNVHRRGTLERLALQSETRWQRLKHQIARAFGRRTNIAVVSVRPDIAISIPWLAQKIRRAPRGIPDDFSAVGPPRDAPRAQHGIRVGPVTELKGTDRCSAQLDGILSCIPGRDRG